jgi:hypothetical protein
MELHDQRENSNFVEVTQLWGIGGISMDTDKAIAVGATHPGTV